MKKTVIASLLLIACLGADIPKNHGLPNRPDDPVIIPGKDLAALAGVHASRLALFRYDGGFVPIPFQLDEKDPAGNYVFTSGDQAGKDPQPGIDGNDELVFMAFDAGRDPAGTVNGIAAPAGAAPSGAGPGLRITLTDPVTGGRAYAYLFSFADKPPRSPLDYISYEVDTAARKTTATGLTYINVHPLNSIYYTEQYLRRPDGTMTGDLADRLKIRGDLSAFMGLLETDYQFDDLVKSRIVGWIDGPVRVVRRGEGYLQIGEIDIQGSGNSIGYYYPTWYIYPMMIDFPVNLRTYLTDITIHGAHDFTRAAFGAHYYDAANPFNEDVVLDGKMSEAEKKMNLTHDHSWLVITAPEWTSVNRIFFPKEWDFIKKQVYYIDDPSIIDPPEDEPGKYAVGYEFANFIGVSKGPVTYYMHYYYPAEFKIGDEKRILEIVDRPVRAEVTPL